MEDIDALVNRKSAIQKRLSEINGTSLSVEDSDSAIVKHDVHWDYVLKEMRWLANDFQKERQRHLGNAKKVCKAVEVYNKGKEARELKKSKDEVLALKKISSKMSGEVRKFWLKINKVIAFKQKVEADEARQKAMDKHLVFLVKQTERYTTMLAENMQNASSTQTDGDDSGDDVDGASYSVVSATSGSVKRIDGLSKYEKNSDSCTTEDEEEFEFNEEPDDETTLIEQEMVEAEEGGGGDGMAVAKEIQLLREEGDIPIEQLRAMYSSMPAAFSDEEQEQGSDSEMEVDPTGDASGSEDSERNAAESDDEFEFNEEEDDETTLIEQELAEAGDVDTEREMRLLQEEGEIPIEQLRAMYSNMPQYSDEEEGEDEVEGDSDEQDSGAESDASTVDNAKTPRNGSSSSSSKPPKGDNNTGEENDEDDEFEFNEEADDETTLIEQEEAEVGVDRSDEMRLLQEEGEIPIEQLRAMYSNMPQYSDDEEEEGEEEEGDDEVEDHEKSEGTDESAPLDKKDFKQGVTKKVEFKVEENTEEAVNDDEKAAEADEAAESDDEFEFNEEEDDETTLIEQELAEAGDVDTEREMRLLQEEGEIPIEQLRAMYSNMPQYSDDEEEEEGEEEVEGDDDSEKMAVEKPGADLGDDEHEDYEDEDEEEFEFNEEPDDETTLIEQEMVEAEEGGGGDGMAVAKEIQLLREEGDIPIEQLRAMYSSMPAAFSDEEQEEESDGDGDGEAGSGDEKSLVSSTNGEKKELNPIDDAFQRLEAADLAARSINVEIPFILSKRLQLREYQHVGLNWLVSLHERRLNGILADEMGLGKTVQTISMLAYLAVNKGIWGPHLIIVPTSCIVNWECEFKRFCPSFKVLTYFGSSKARKQLRNGWMKLNSFHVCITSYQLVVQDTSSFRRKRWYYMILDEAHNIKNFKSKRWQTLLNFNTQRRLLLTGTPLQNNLMELWSLMHFLMPHIFRSRKEFSYWFSNPLNNMVEGNRSVNNDLINRLHSIMRPFLLRRLKKDVAKQLPGKFEHIVMCKLSKRQSHLYEEFMARSSTRSSLTGGNFLGMMNILMQLRKVCNHPDLFEPRPITSPFLFSDGVSYASCPMLFRALEKHPLDRLSDNYTSLWCYEWDQPARQRVASLQCSREQFFLTVEDVSLDHSLVREASGGGSNRSVLAFLDSYVSQRRAHLQVKAEANWALCRLRCDVQHSRLSLNWRSVQALLIPIFTQVVQRARYDPRVAKEVPLCWLQLIKSEQDRAEEMRDVISNFVFVLPSAVSKGVQIVSSGLSNSTSLVVIPENKLTHDCREAIKQSLDHFYPARIRQQIFFPDRKLIQFDSGKLQTLAVLLRDLKKDGHKCLIFTQMSKMLDVLEIFLNLNDHTFVRLDGSTSIDRRQKLMDRFNSDPKLFCFILSTRSGGLGINLTGADCVIFYDSDWNPAMDAQAQDRAHRIGQTREVHIYRMICASTVEENILLKAKQKKHLDFLVMTEGNFSEASLFSAKGLKDVLGGEGGLGKMTEAEVLDDAGAIPAAGASSSGSGGGMSKSEIEAAMLAAEDEEDVSAMRGATAEAAKEMDEFDENAPVVVENDLDNKDNEEGGGGGEAGGGGLASAGVSSSNLTALSSNTAAEERAKEERDMEAEFASWQAKVGFDFNALQSALKPVERFALSYRTDIEPFYSMFYTSQQTRLAEMIESEKAEQWDIDEIEREKEEDEIRALSEGELLATNINPASANRLRRMFLKERARRLNERKTRRLTGAAWSLTVEGGFPFWYNKDTGEGSFSTPHIIVQREQFAAALERGYNSVPLNIMVKIFSYLAPYPDRIRLSVVCARWKEAAFDESFVKRVFSVETGVRDAKVKLNRDVYASIGDALKDSLPGDRISLGPGHHWESTLDIAHPLQIFCDSSSSGGGGEVDPSRCVVELVGQVRVRPGAGGVVLFGVTVRRPRRVKEATSCISVQHAKLQIFNCLINNEGAKGSCVFVTDCSTLSLNGCRLKGGITGITAIESDVYASNTVICENRDHGIAQMDSFTFAEDSTFCLNSKSACSVFGDKDVLALSHCDVKGSARVMSCDYDDKTANIHRLLTHNCISDEALSAEISSSPMLVDTLNYLNPPQATNAATTSFATYSSATSMPSTASSASVSSPVVGRKRPLVRYNEDSDGDYEP